jgi:hypothetical protein
MHIESARYDGTLWMWTSGLADLGQNEIATPLREEGGWRAEYCEQLLAYIERYIASQPKRVSARQTMTYGWNILRYRESQPSDAPSVAGKLIIQEVDDAWETDQPSYQDGCDESLRLKRIQDRVIMRHHISGDAYYPNRRHFAVTCSNVSSQLPASFFMERLPLGENEDSGEYTKWFIGCVDRSHDHNRPENLHRLHLSHIVEQRHEVFPYLALPHGSAVMYEPDKVIVFAPGAQHGHAEYADPFTDLDDMQEAEQHGD